MDGTATIWEERAEGGHGGGSGNGAIWIDRAKLTEARKRITNVKFAPRHLRLQLATASADGSVRIYEAVDVTNLSHWLLKSSIEAEVRGGVVGGDLGVGCLDWCTGRFEPPTIVLGGGSGGVVVYRYSDASRSWGVHVKLEGHVNPRKGKHLNIVIIIFALSIFESNKSLRCSGRLVGAKRGEELPPDRELW